MTTLIAQGPVDVNVSRCTVRVKTTVWADKRGLHTKKSLTFLRRQCEGFNILAEDISAMGVEEVLPRIVNLDKVKDGIYEVVVRDKSYDYETGYVDDYDYRLVTANAALTGAEGVRVEGTVMQHNDEELRCLMNNLTAIFTVSAPPK